MVQKVQHIKRVHNVLALDGSGGTMNVKVLSLDEIKAKWKEHKNALIERYQHINGISTSDGDSERLALEYINTDDFWNIYALKRMKVGYMGMSSALLVK